MRTDPWLVSAEKDGSQDGNRAGLAMSPDSFERQIEAARRRLVELEERAHGPADQRALLLESLEDLSATLEELHAAEGCAAHAIKFVPWPPVGRPRSKMNDPPSSGRSGRSWRRCWRLENRCEDSARELCEEGNRRGAGEGHPMRGVTP